MSFFYRLNLIDERLKNYKEFLIDEEFFNLIEFLIDELFFNRVPTLDKPDAPLLLYDVIFFKFYL